MKLKKIALISLSVIVSLVLLEAALRSLPSTIVYSPKANQMYDDKLGHRMDPSLKDIDEKGYRNPVPLKQADIVVLGDSHTYGVNVKSEESWPSQLDGMTDMTVYNMGVGSYGTLQYDYLIDDAIALKPKYIILGLYVANDLDDVCKLINKSDYWKVWAGEHGYDAGVCADSPGWLSRIKETFLKQHIVWIIASAIKRVDENTSLGDAIVVNEGTNHTIIKRRRISSHGKKMDLGKERIALGFQITKDIIRDMKTKADENGVDFSVVFIPSKERVFFDYLIGKGYELPPDYYQLVDNENALVKEFSAYFSGLGIDYADAGPYVLSELYVSGPDYPQSDDGHPIGNGYRAYARAAYEGVITDNEAEAGREVNPDTLIH